MLIRINEDMIIQTNNILTITTYSTKSEYGLAIRMNAPVYESGDSLIVKNFDYKEERDKIIKKLMNNKENKKVNDLVKENIELRKQIGMVADTFAVQNKEEMEEILQRRKNTPYEENNIDTELSCRTEEKD